MRSGKIYIKTMYNNYSHATLRIILTSSLNMKTQCARGLQAMTSQTGENGESILTHKFIKYSEGMT